MEVKYIIGILFLLLAGVALYIAKMGAIPGCDGWAMLNPICLTLITAKFLMTPILYIVAGVFAFAGILCLALPEDKLIFVVGMLILGVLLIIDLLVQDPIPWIDEILLSVGTGWCGLKALPLGSASERVDEMF